MAQSVFTQMSQQPFVTLLKVESTTWNRDSHELFDYESRHTYDRKFLLRKHARVFRNTQQVEIVSDGQQLPTNADYLLSVKARDGRYYVYPADRNVGGQNLQPRKLWLIIKHLPMEHYPLNEGDVIKLGRFKLRVKQIVTETNGNNSPIDFKLDDVEVPTSDLTPEESQSMQCRICLLEGGVDDDPLVRACQCKGSIMYVHLDCLRHWVNGRLNLTEDPARSCCFIRQLQCELCKSPYPSTVTTRGVRLPIVKVPNVQPPFIVLENMVGPTNRGVHLCSMAVKKECKLGRGHESDVRIADVSISRFHAMIRYQDGCFYLQDHQSKFGTLVALRKPTVVEKAEKLSVQVGRTVLHFTLEDVAAGSIVNDVTELADSPRQQQQQQQQTQTFNQQPSGIPETRQPDNATGAGHVTSASQSGTVGLSSHVTGYSLPAESGGQGSVPGATGPSLMVGANVSNYSIFAPMTPIVGPVSVGSRPADANGPGGPGAAAASSSPQNLPSSGGAPPPPPQPATDSSRNANVAFRANPISYSRPTMAGDNFPIDSMVMGYASFVPRPYALLPTAFPSHMMEHDASAARAFPGDLNAPPPPQGPNVSGGNTGHFRTPGLPDWGLLIAPQHISVNADGLTPLMMGADGGGEVPSNADEQPQSHSGVDGREADVPSRSRPIIAPGMNLAALTRPVDSTALYLQDGRTMQRVYSPSKRSVQRARNASTPPVDQLDQADQAARVHTPPDKSNIGFPGSAQAMSDPRFVNALASKLQAMQTRFPQRPKPSQQQNQQQVSQPQSSSRPAPKSPTAADSSSTNTMAYRVEAQQMMESWNNGKEECMYDGHMQRRPPTLMQPSSPYCPPECRAMSPYVQGVVVQQQDGAAADVAWRLGGQQVPTQSREAEPRTPTSSSIVAPPTQHRVTNWQSATGPNEVATHSRGPGRPDQGSSPRTVAVVASSSPSTPHNASTQGGGDGNGNGHLNPTAPATVGG